MRRIQTEVLVIGGGATGTGILRDLAMRGFKAILVEKGDLTNGTTGRYHGLLHSGGRYVVNDPPAAKECIEENRILRYIMPQCIEDTSGFFVITPWDQMDYALDFLEGCQIAGIPVEEIAIDQMLREEPLLNPRIARCFRVPDASADSFLGAKLNYASAREYGAQILTYHQVVELFSVNAQELTQEINNTSSTPGSRVTGALCHDLVNDEEISIYADIVVNASGVWAGKIAGLAGVKVHIIGSKGTMVAMNHRIVNTVINRCKMPSDGDILVPAHTVSIIGTTDVKITDPDTFGIEPWEVNLCLEEGDKLVPGFKNMRVLRTWAGVRPLYQERQVGNNRDITRAFVLLDHEKRDGVAGLITITSGKWTTYRKMAEATVDLVCEKLDTRRACHTHLEPLPKVKQDGGYHYLGARLKTIEMNLGYGDIICECELATRQDVEDAIIKGRANTIDDIRRDVRLGMGPCQGGFCTYRVAGMLHDLGKSRKGSVEHQPRVDETNVALRDFLQERWKGLLPILWGQQLRQERLDELIYVNVLNADHLPGSKTSRLSPVNYTTPVTPQEQPPAEGNQQYTAHNNSSRDKSKAALDVLVIGAGLSGLVAAWQAGLHGKRVRLITKGWGTTHLSSGCIDVLGYYPPENETPVETPRKTIEQLIQSEPSHPYALVGLDNLEKALEEFMHICVEADYPLSGSLNHNFLLPTALGTIRPTCVAPFSMIAGNLRDDDPICVVGFKQFNDFYPHLIADNLSEQGIPTYGIILDLTCLRERRFVNGHLLARLFDLPDFRAEVIQTLKSKVDDAERVGFPAVVGLNDPQRALHDLESQLKLPVFEISTLPPSIPGMRLHRILVNAIKLNGGHVFNGMEAINYHAEGECVHTVLTKTANRSKPHKAETFILATGSILSGGVNTNYNGYAQETVFNLSVNAPSDRTDWFARDFLAQSGHPIFRAGITVDDKFRPLIRGGETHFSNLHLAGSQLGNCDVIRERSLEGVAIGTGFAVGRMLSK